MDYGELHLDEKWIVPSDRLELGKLLYSGEFSYVCEGELKQKSDEGPLKVAVKLLKGMLEVPPRQTRLPKYVDNI